MNILAESLQNLYLSGELSGSQISRAQGTTQDCADRATESLAHRRRAKQSYYDLSIFRAKVRLTLFVENCRRLDLDLCS